jgi:hypothetical protein
MFSGFCRSRLMAIAVKIRMISGSVVPIACKGQNISVTLQAALISDSET